MTELARRAARARPGSLPRLRAARGGRPRDERRLAWLLCAPAVGVMLLVTGLPVGYAVWLSLHRYDLRFPGERRWVGFENYAAVLGSAVFRSDLLATLVITVVSVLAELVVGLTFALVMHHAVVARRTLRAAILLPYGLVAVVAAFAWRYAFAPDLSFFTDRAWLSERWSSFAVIIATEVWKTTPLVSLLLLAGLAAVPPELYETAKVDGATAWQRLRGVTLPAMRSAVLVATLFCTLDGFRLFDTVYVQTGGANGTETLSLGVYHQVLDRLNLGLGSAFSVVLFALAALIAFLFVRGLHTDIGQVRGDREVS